MQALPHISLITPSFMQADFLEHCLASVHAQGYPALEHIVVDGGSTDGSVAVIERYAHQLAWWCSERDRGQSHAINKGLAHATGAVFGWLNSDDLLLPDALSTVAAAFADDPELLIFGGRRIFRSATGADKVSGLDGPDVPDALFTDPLVNQQSTFFRMDAVKRIGGVEEALHYAMDLELWWQVLFANGTLHLRFDPVDLAVFRSHEESKTFKQQASFPKETAAILRQLAVQLDQRDLVRVLDLGYVAAPKVRPMPVAREHIPIVRRMIIHFLLKWDHAVHERSQFEMMRSFRRTVDLSAVPMDDVQQQKLALLDRQLSVPGWLAFRVKRKIHHLLS